MASAEIRARLEYLRQELRAERISMSDLIDLQGLADQIDPGDVELLEAAGVPEFPTEEQTLLATARYIVEHGSDGENYISDGDLDGLETYFDADGNHDAAVIVNAAFRMKGVFDFQVKTQDNQYVAVAALVLVAFAYADTPRN